MPLYDYGCTVCGFEFERLRAIAERNEELCRECGEPAQIIFKSKSAGLSLFRPGFYEHVGEGVHCDTPQQLQDACNEHGSYSAYLENSVFNVKRDYDGHVEREYHAKEERNRDWG